MAADNQQQLDELLQRFDTAMLVTATATGMLRARPMAVAAHRGGGILYFATRVEDGKLDELIADARVAVTMQQGNRYVSITGIARIEIDRALADEIWSAAMRVWFPEGASDPALVLIRVEPEQAEFWDRSGVRALEFYWQAGHALVTGKKPDDQTLSGHGKLSFRAGAGQAGH